MCRIRRVFASLDFKWDRQSSFALVVFHGNLYSSIDVSLEPIHGRPDVLFHVQKLVDAHDRLPSVSFMDNSIRSRLGANEDLGPGLELRQLAVQVFLDFIARRVDLEDSLKLTR
jgi:hypothetical protein